MSCIYKYKGKNYTKDEFYSLVRTTMVQPRTVQKYEKVLFPTGDTASKVEGHTTLEEFKKQKEDRIKELEDSKPRLEKGKDEYYIWYKDNFKDEEFAERFKTKEEAESSINENLKNIDTEINQLKQELERVEKEGFGALKPIYKFYEETVRNILNKTYGKENINSIIDEYKNSWFELDLSKVENTHIYFSKHIDKNSKQFQKLTSEEKAKTIEQVTKEHRSIVALKDLSAKFAHRIGGTVKFENNPNADWKGYNQGMTSVLNEAYMTPDTPFHEILAHPIIRAIKNKNLNKVKIDENNVQEFTYKGDIYKTERSIFGYSYKNGKEISDSEYDNILSQYLKEGKNTELYQSILKELETDRGKEVFEQVKRDYKYKEAPFSEQEQNIAKSLIDTYKKLGKQPSEKELRIAENKRLEYTLEEQQEEAIVTLLGLMAADKLDAKKDATLISKLKELWKQISDFVKQLLLQDGIKIDELPITTTLNDLAEIMAYGNNKIILPGYKVEYSTPLGNKYDTLEEINNEIRGLADADVEVDLSGIKVERKHEVPDKFIDNKGISYVKKGDYWEVDFTSNSPHAESIQEYSKVENITEENFEKNRTDNVISPVKEGFGESEKYIKGDFIYEKIDLIIDDILYYKFPIKIKLNKNQIESIYTYHHGEEDISFDDEFTGNTYILKHNIDQFIERNKEYEQSKEIIEQWKKENNIQYDPEEVYSRGQGFYSSIGAYSNLELDLLLKNLIQHIEDNKKAGGEFTISAFTKPIDKRLKHIEGTGDRVRFVIYPKSNHIKWAAPIDVYSGSVWDAHKKVSKDKKSELLGVSFTKTPTLRNINKVSPNLADIIDNLSHAHNELGIELTTNNFRIEYDDNIDYSTKKLIDNINKILDDKYGKLNKPEINKIQQVTAESFEEVQELKKQGWIEVGRSEEGFPLFQRGNTNNLIKQPTQTKKNTTSIESVLDNYNKNDRYIPSGDVGYVAKDDLGNITDVFDDIKKAENQVKLWQETNPNDGWRVEKINKSKEKEYTSQALTNLKIAALKEVARKYPRSLITSKVVPINPNMVDNSEIQYSKRETKQLSRPEQLLQRRIDRLTKQVTLEKDTIKKTKLQQQLDYTIEQYSRAQESENPTPVYREFGEYTLDLAENRINSIKEGNSTDLNADLEYINDVLDVWDDFKGLRDRVAELRESIQALNDQLLVDNVNESYNSEDPISLESIKSQNKDIGTFKYWTGALLDLPNYLAHAIGFNIRTSQNNIERKTNQIYYDIDNKIKELSKSSNKSIQSIYDEIIEYNKVFDTKTLIKEDELNSKSKEAQEFYHFYQSKMEELIEITPTLTRRNSKGELETFTLNKYFIPNIPKNSFKNTLKNFNPVKERSVGNTIKDEEQKADIINLNYIRKIPASEKSDDLGNSLFLFAKDMYNYDEMSKILPKVRLLQREIEKISYIQGSNPNYTKTGKDSNIYKMTEAFIKAQIKGEYKEEQGRSITWGTKTDEKGNTTEKYLDITGTIDNLLKWNSLLRIGLSPVGASANIGFGKLSNFMEAIGGRFFNRTHLRQAERIFWNQTFNEDSVLNKELLSKYNILQELTDREQAENLREGKYKKLSSEKLIELMYAPQKYGEKWIQSSTLLAIMIHDGYMNEKGELTKKFNDATQAEKEKLFGKITGINNKLHGRYSPKEAAAMQQHVFYRAITQFRKWIPAAIEARFDEKHYDPRLGVEVEGRYRTFGREVLLKLAKGDVTNAFYNLFMPLINAKEALESGKLSQSDIYNMRKMLIESVLAIATLVLYSIGTGDDPEDKKKRKEAWFKSTMLLLNRISGDLTFFYSPNQINNLTKNAIPMSKLVDDLLKIGPEIPNAFDSKKNKFKSGNSKGQYKLPKRIISVIPGSKAPYDLIKIFNKQALDEVK